MIRKDKRQGTHEEWQRNILRLTCEDKGRGSSHESEECTRVGACGQVSTLSERHVDVVVSVFERGWAKVLVAMN